MARWCNAVSSRYTNVANWGVISSFVIDSAVAISFGGRCFPPSFFSSLLLFSGLAWLVKPPVVVGWIGEGLGHWGGGFIP